MKTDFFSEKKYINAYLVCVFLFLLVGLFQSWNVAFSILNLCLISAIMSIGINIQWGNSGIVNFGVMGFAAIGGLCGVLISMPPTLEVWKDGTAVILIILFSFLISGILVKKFLKKSPFTVQGTPWMPFSCHFCNLSARLKIFNVFFSWVGFCG